MPRGVYKTPDPTHEEIAKATAEIRAGWTPLIEWQRRVQKASQEWRVPVMHVDCGQVPYVPECL